MSVRILLSFFLFGTLTNFSFAQDIYQKNELVDIQNYVFDLHLNDASNEIKGETQVTILFKENVVPFSLDLIQKAGKFGMEVTEVLENDSKANYTFANNKINIVPKITDQGSQTFTIRYKGIPERGLVIDTTKFGKRSFFGDNWPNLARHWLPSVDHPYDKASVEFRITAPDHYDVVATGKKIEESNLENGYKLTIYNEPAPVATPS